MTPTINMHAVESSQIAEVGHSPEAQILAIRFKGKNGPGALYHYGNFPADKFADFMAAKSIGSYFIMQIKGDASYPYTVIPDAPVDAATIEVTPAIEEKLVVPEGRNPHFAGTFHDETPDEAKHRRKLADLAQAAHEACREYCISIGDDTQKSWFEAPQKQRDIAILGVQHALDGATPEQLHESWVALKRADGWVYGEVKDDDAKTHPCILSYADLPEEHRQKDQIFRDTVLGAAAK